MRRHLSFKQTSVPAKEGQILFPYGDFYNECISDSAQGPYLFPINNGLVSIRFRPDMSSREHSALEATVDIVPGNKEIPKVIRDLLKKYNFVKR